MNGKVSQTAAAINGWNRKRSPLNYESRPTAIPHVPIRSATSVRHIVPVIHGRRTPLNSSKRKSGPILVEHCLKCHGGDTTKEPKGGLRVDSREALLKGGDSGPSLVPGEPAKSRLLEAVKYGNVDLQMPPKGKLPDAVIRDLETWIKAGAVWPGDVKKAEGKVAFDLAKRKAEHWCWTPLHDPIPPAVADKSWNANPIDRFIRAKLDSAKVTPNPPADPATLLRRLSFDLTGLPPSVEDVNAIRSGKKSYEAFVEQYLASPHFGERWARHWMDVVRYADTRGHEFDHPIPYAWRYRDYSFARSMPICRTAIS